MSNGGSDSVIIVLCVALIMFIIGREIVCWYWKINKSVGLQEQILEELKKLNSAKSRESMPEVVSLK